MEFRYNRKPLVLYGVLAVIGLFLLGNEVYVFYSSRLGRGWWIVTYLSITAFSLFGFRFYYLNWHTIIVLNDEGISYQNGENKTFIKWSDIQYITTDVSDSVDFLNPSSIFSMIGSNDFYIRISDGSGTIEIGSKLQGIASVIRAIKSKALVDFDTRDIPLEYKQTSHF